MISRQKVLDFDHNRTGYFLDKLQCVYWHDGTISQAWQLKNIDFEMIVVQPKKLQIRTA